MSPPPTPSQPDDPRPQLIHRQRLIRPARVDNTQHKKEKALQQKSESVITTTTKRAEPSDRSGPQSISS